jgi:aspartate carbamoyltransferase catalytic subunit
MNRGVEIAAEVADLPRSVIIDQVRNGVAVRMAVLFLLLGSGVAAGDAELPAAGSGPCGLPTGAAPIDALAGGSRG